MTRVKHTEDFQIEQPVDVLFPLFSPEGEKYWVPGWDYKNIMASNELHEDYIFITEKLDQAASDSVWLVKIYLPESHYVEFYKVEPDYKVGIITVKCHALSEARTRVSVSYEWIALTDSGNEFIAGFTHEKYREFIGEWKRLLEDYFKG